MKLNEPVKEEKANLSTMLTRLVDQLDTRSRHPWTSRKSPRVKNKSDVLSLLFLPRRSPLLFCSYFLSSSTSDAVSRWAPPPPFHWLLATRACSLGNQHIA